MGILTGRTGENTFTRGRRRTDARRSEETGRAVWGIERKIIMMTMDIRPNIVIIDCLKNGSIMMTR